MHFIPLDCCERVLEASRIELLRLKWTDEKNGRNDRFVKQGGKIFVHPNYKCPHFDDISELYYKALECAKSEKEISRFIAKRTKKSEHAIYFYFRNFKFKNPDFARIVTKLLKIFIKQNNLFAEIENG
ncbi:hypothetical protein NYG85_03810 [Campylobacter sp. PS10]|uniref:Uncharacterized protein n=1 Tax=Campylobacter gastrosuis TaxID=2974576 RepID=A0ABT7HP57_9BACT|nr:hypothetical protein [Campylobacter gastrosuis]